MEQKIVVTMDRLNQIAIDVLRKAREHFGNQPLLSYSDDYLEYVIHPWMDDYIREHYLFPGQPSKADLDDAIAAFMNGD